MNSYLDIMKNHPLLAAKYCENCGQAFVEGDIKVKKAGESPDGLTIIRSCKHCGVSNIIRMSPMGSLMVHRTESNNTDVIDFASNDPIDDNEAIMAYEKITEAKTINDLIS